jgi:hypothetical protein
MILVFCSASSLLNNIILPALSFLVDLTFTFVFHFMLYPKPEPECITVPVPLMQKVAGLVPVHNNAYQWWLSMVNDLVGLPL